MDTISVVALAVTSGVTTAAITIPGLSVLTGFGTALQLLLVPTGIIAFLISVIGWAFAKGVSPQWASRFMGGMGIALAAVMLGAAAPTLADWALGIGGQVK